MAVVLIQCQAVKVQMTILHPYIRNNTVVRTTGLNSHIGSMLEFGGDFQM